MTIFDKAADTLKEVFHASVSWTGQPQTAIDTGVDAEIVVTTSDGQSHRFIVAYRREVRAHQLGTIIELRRDQRQRPFLLCADTLFAGIREKLRELGVNYVDGAGNMFIRTPKLHIYIDGLRAKEPKPRVHGAFTRAGLRVIYQFLADGTTLNQAYRQIAEKAGVGLETLSKTVHGLRSAGYILAVTNDVNKLTKKKELLDRWVGEYGEKLKPSLHLRTYRFAEKEATPRWQSLELRQGQTCWGGEPAGGLLTGYLMPEIFTLYSNEPEAELMRSLRLVPDSEGNVFVYRPFWRLDKESAIAPPLVVYADLVGTGDPRNLETATRIWESHVANLIR